VDGIYEVLGAHDNIHLGSYTNNYSFFQDRVEGVYTR
jgi:hypothetical protein